ncbi:hypothetical protein [Shewanella sedimentimangrovi]|uniref:Uncharacterized protein n=1 Tax=Shewanella sedimentimangrovi TaxID=2814293 RepID=A0ABX7R404_9GAMM|nr:hypothetical protein [Shewanella sedimentimangrovi]QSX37815.1 hypothetical protein JYB85_02945 [Shewanella sedimentimangrovi]
MYQLKLDNEGLLPLEDITCLNERIFYGELEVFIDPNVSSVFSYLMANDNLKCMSKIRCLEHRQGIKRAPIFGVPFSKALVWFIPCVFG